MTYPYHHDANKRKLVAPGTKLRKRDVNDAHMRTLRGDDGVPHVGQAPPIDQSRRSFPNPMRAQDRDPCTVPGLILVGEDQGRFFLSFFSIFYDGAGLGRSVTSQLAMTPATLTNQALTRETRKACDIFKVNIGCYDNEPLARESDC